MNLDIHIIDNCNRNCCNCFHYSCIATQSNIKNGVYFKKLFLTLHPSIKTIFSNINILGGEPFLNDNLNDIITVFRDYFTENEITIYTNGILLLNSLRNKDINILNTIISNNIKVFISVHDDNYNDYKEELLELISANNLKSDFIKIHNCNKFLKIDFEIKDNKIVTHDAVKNYKSCKVKPVPNAKFTTFQLVGTKLIGCAKAAYSYILNEYLEDKLILSDSDQLDISKVKTEEEIKNFINKGTLDFCKYCNFFNNKVPCGTCKDYKQFLKWSQKSDSNR